MSQARMGMMGSVKRIGIAAKGATIAAIALGLTACGGGGGGGIGGTGDPPSSGNKGSWTPGVFMPSGTFAAQCVNPRSGIDPQTGAPYRDISGARSDENNWVRSWMNELYLWYDEVPDLDPTFNTSTVDYFRRLLAPRDRYSFALPTDEYLQAQQAGVQIDYGIQWVLFEAQPPREMRVAHVDPGTDAYAAGIRRGDALLFVDDTDFVLANDRASVDALNAALFAPEEGQTHSFVFRARDSGATRPATLQAARIAYDPVPTVTVIDRPAGKTGYILFNDHNAVAEKRLIDAIAYLDAEGVTSLVLDLRYNGGGFLYIASQLAYMTAGPAQTSGRVFERLAFNDKYPPTVNPIDNSPLQPIPFFDVSTEGTNLPTLELDRVYVLTGANTCSASESIINGLRGIGVEVIQIGATTCGKPYGFFPTDNCGTTYLAVQFKGENDAGFGEYDFGFGPAGSTDASAELPGCPVADDFEHELGDPLEARLAAALAHHEGSGCPSAAAQAPVGSAKAALPSSIDEGSMPRSPLRENRILDWP